ncbi:MAG: hypothetical protein D3910_28105 [Candidatus Electrothrix sp. ATG2]|nr:hypothetical protein [Candidatus Electrothrix sp. ATG2]
MVSLKFRVVLFYSDPHYPLIIRVLRSSYFHPIAGELNRELTSGFGNHRVAVLKNRISRYGSPI